jgi:alpha-mannosidase
MKIKRLLVILPCYNLENLELDRGVGETGQILSAWTALYHPALIYAAQSTPNWLAAYNAADEDFSESLVILPECSETLLPEDWSPDHAPDDCLLLRKIADRRLLIEAVQAKVDDFLSAVDSDLIADFFALGYCRLIVELLTRRLHYQSNLDETAFCESLLVAANATVAGDRESAIKFLQSAFDRLHDAREYFFPNEPCLLDLTLLASTTLGDSLRQELSGAGQGAARNCLCSGEVLNEMSVREPESLAQLKASIEQKTAGLIGGELTELPLPLLLPEAIAKGLEDGIAVYKKHLGRRPSVFGRRLFGLTPALPQILEKCGFTAALHFTLDDGKFPTGNQSRVAWEGIDGTTIDALARIPLDARTDETFLALPQRLGNCLELDHTPALLFAHWPGVASSWYEDFRRIAKYSRVLGRFCTIDEYFEQAESERQTVFHRSDEYRSPYLSQDAAEGNRDAISRSVKRYREHFAHSSIQTLSTLSTLLNVGWDQQNAVPPQPDSLKTFAEKISNSTNRESGYLLVNPTSFAQRTGVLLPELGGTPKITDVVRAADENAAIVDLPGLGFVWIDAQASVDANGKKNSDPLLAEAHCLRNEHFELKFDPATGAIRSISDYSGRYPRLSQQLALRIPQDESDPAADRHYSVMVADELRVLASTAVLGEMLSRGRLLDREGQELASFQQVTRVWRGSRTIELEIELDPLRMPDARPWNSYYASRFAWHHEDCAIFRSVNGTNQPSDLAALESPLFVDIRTGKLRTTILGGGLPYHRRIGPRKLDTLLIVQGENDRKFRLGIALDAPNPTTAALAFLAPPLKLFGAFKPATDSGWLFHIDHRNIIITSILPSPFGRGAGGEGCAISPSPIDQEIGHSGCNGNEKSSPLGCRLRLLETEGRPAQLKVRCPYLLDGARKLTTGDTPPQELAIESDTFSLTLTPYQWIDVEVLFQT